MPEMVDWTSSVQLAPHVGAGREFPEKPPIGLLVFDDSRFDCEVLERGCRAAHLPVDVTRVETFESFQRVIRSSRFDVAFLDYYVPGGDGLLAHDMLRAAPQNAQVPTIMITNSGQHEVAVKAMKSGCLDYLSKESLSPARLAELVMNAVLTRMNSVQPVPVDPSDDLKEAVRQVLAEQPDLFKDRSLREMLDRTGLLPGPPRMPDLDFLFGAQDVGFEFRQFRH